MLDVSDKPCVIVGGGGVAERKAQGLLDAGARVTVISLSFTPQLEVWERSGRLILLREAYRSELPQLKEALLVFAATDDPEVNTEIRLEAQAWGKLVNDAYDGEQSGFIVPAVVRRGKLLLTVSTSGASPAVARRLKQELETAFGPEYELYLDLLQELRHWVQRNVPGTLQRQEMFRLMLGWPMLDWVRRGIGREEAAGLVLERMATNPTPQGMAQVGAWMEEQMRT